MSNIYEALEQAQRERHNIQATEIVVEPGKSPVEVGPLSDYIDAKSTDLRQMDIATLYRSIDSLLPECSKRTIQFISAQEGEGVSTIVREMAITATNHLGKKVLVLDAAHHNPTQHKFHNVRFDQGWHDIVKSGGILKDACLSTVNPNLYVSPLTRSTKGNPYFVDIQASVLFLNEVKKRFDLILIDSAPATIAPDSIALSRYADGVILVLEAERTKRAAVENLRDKIEKSGGTILGIVFNKRRYHIPQRIYQWLYC